MVFFFTYYLFTIVPPNIYHSFQLVVQLSILSYYSLPRIFHSLFNIAYHLLLFIVISYRTFLLFLFLTIIYLLSNIDCRHPLLFIIIYRYLSSAYSRSLSPSSLVTFLFRCVCRAHDDNIVEWLHAIITLVTAFERKIERRSGPKRSIETNDSRISVSPNRMEAKSSQWVKNQRQALGNGNLFILEAF